MIVPTISTLAPVNTMPSEQVLLTGNAGKQIAMQRLRSAITRGDAAPGHRLVEAELSDEYGVTRNSVRLALDALTAEGLVERIPNRGARVRKVTTAEAVAIMECRMVLDGLLSRKAAERATPEDIAGLRANGQAMAAAVAAGELRQYSELIQTHHALVRAMARHEAASTLVERLLAQIVRNQYQLSLRAARAQQSLGELQRVIQAIADGDGTGAEAAAREHLRQVAENIRREDRSAG
jgi:DNA-binding GntR family transcriptional regulator